MQHAGRCRGNHLSSPSLGAADIYRWASAPPGCPGTRGTHSDPPAQSGDRCRFLLRPVTSAASGVLVAAYPGLPMGSQTDIPRRCIDDRCGAADVRVAGGRCCRAGPAAQPVPGPCGAQRQRRARSPGTASVLPRAGWCSGHWAAVGPVCRHQRPGGKAGFLPPSKRRPELGLHQCQRAGRTGALTAMPPPRRHVRQPAPVRVERTVTTPMSRSQHEQALPALAVLITAWQRGHDAEPGEDPADTLPLPAPGEQL